MTKKQQQCAIVAGVVCVVMGWWLATSPASPLHHKEHERPVLKVIAKVAKGLMWFMLVAEKPQQDQRVCAVHARVDSQGNPVLNHGEGW